MTPPQDFDFESRLLLAKTSSTTSLPAHRQDTRLPNPASTPHTVEMAPKKKGNKKGGDDDWEAELGETVAPAAPAAEGAENDAPAEEEEEVGGLMATLRKNREKRKKKGIQDDAVEGEDAPGAAAPVEASAEDEWNLPEKKGKGGKGGKQADKPADAGAADEAGEGGRVLTKAEKEKLKKEKEKQRKKEMVCARHRDGFPRLAYMDGLLT